MAGELGATLIVQKEITIPSSPLNLNTLEHGQVDGAPRIPRLASPPAIHDADVSPLSLTDGESSSDDVTASKSKAQRPNNVAAAVGQSFLAAPTRSSPQPIIRDYPYGFNAWSYSRTPSTSQLSSSSTPGTSLSLPTFSEPDSDVDDDAAFAFDLDISNFSGRSSASASKTVILMEDERPVDVPNQWLHRQMKHRKPKMLEAPIVDPAEKARRRRLRRVSNRERRQLGQNDPLADDLDSVAGDDAGHVLALDDGVNRSATEQVQVRSDVASSPISTPYSLDTQLTLSDDVTSEDLAVATVVRKKEDGNGGPRLIAEALIVRKFMVEIEETYFGLDKLRL